MRELRDLYDSESELTGKTYYKGDPIPKGFHPMVVMTAIQNSNGEFLMQRRVPSKGGDWGITGGHPKAGETPIEGMITEVKEELGLDTKEEDFELFCSGCDGRDCYKMFYMKRDLDITKLDIQLEELTEVRWFSINELEEMVKTKELNPNQVDFFRKCMIYLKYGRNYYMRHVFPTNEEFLKLFNSVGWDRAAEKIEENRKNTCFAVCAYENGEIVGMGRVVGDGSYFTIYDLVVDKDHQGKGVGQMLILDILDWYYQFKDADTFLYLTASKGKEGFYEKFGFRVRPNEDVGSGMKWYE